jgi:hypothetical protein
VRQLRTGWSDGPAYVTQCPIQTGQSFTYSFTLTGQRGTLLWHGHVNWLRATVHGAIVILPKLGVPYPFPKPDEEKIIILGELEILKLATIVFCKKNSMSDFVEPQCRGVVEVRRRSCDQPGSAIRSGT